MVTLLSCIKGRGAGEAAGTWGPWRKPVGIDVMSKAELMHDFAQRMLGPRLILRMLRKKKPMCWRKQNGGGAQQLPLFSSSFSNSPSYPLYWNYISFQSYMVPEELFGSLVSPLPQRWSWNSSKLKTNTISVSLVAYQFLECCPAGLDQSTKITWKLWLAQSPVHFFSFVSISIWILSDPIEGGNHGKGLEAAILGHTCQEFVLPQISLFRPVFSWICCPDYNFYPICGYFDENRVHLLRLCSAFFLFSPHGSVSIC